MNEADSDRLAAELADALAADDPRAAVEELARRYAGDTGAADRVAEFRRTLDALGRLRQRIEGETFAGKAWSPPSRRAWPIRLAVGAAAAAAVVLLALGLLPRGDRGDKPPGETAVADAATDVENDSIISWQVPTGIDPTLVTAIEVNPRSLSMPRTNEEPWCVPTITWTVPTTEDLLERSEDHDAKETGAVGRSSGPVCGRCADDHGLGGEHSPGGASAYARRPGRPGWRPAGPAAA